MSPSRDHGFPRLGADKTNRFRKMLTAITLLSAVLIALVLLTRYQSEFLPPSLPLASSDVQTSDETQVSWMNNDGNILRPQDHVYRDAKTLIYYFQITAEMRRPDNVLKRVYLVNGNFPGPTIEARSGDRLVIEVENALDDEEPLSLHWHGLSMRGANDMDGAAGITQTSLKPGHNFTYDFQVEDTQHGTFWYHAHEGVQRADGLYGGLIIHKPFEDASEPMKPAMEHLLLIGDWYHQSASTALKRYMHPGAFGLETVPDSMIVNGKGTFQCSDAVAARPVDCISSSREDLSVLDLDRSRTNIVRLVNVGAYAGYDIALKNVSMTPITVDGGHRIQGRASDRVGVLHPGERMDLQIEMDADVADLTWMTIAFDETPFKYQNPALTSSQDFPVRVQGQQTGDEKLYDGRDAYFDIQNATSLDIQFTVLPQNADQTLVLYAITQKLAHLENEPHGFINQTTWKPPEGTPLLGLTRSRWNSNQFVPNISYYGGADAQWIDIVINNLDEEGHPFHLHGHDFWVLSTHTSTYNWGSYNPFEDLNPPGGEYDLARPLKKDTVYVPRRGYAVLRFKADNFGVWMFHCHVLWHMASGMAMSFDIR